MTELLKSTLLRIAQSVPDYTAFPTVDEMAARTRALEAERDPLVEIRRVGISRDGEPIDLISIGSGPRDALVVGTPHPNEPIGCLTIEFLIDELRRNASLRESLGYRWHFIKTIEPDGLRFNEGWLKRPLEPLAYFEHFFRPAAQEQAEYCFPMTVEGYSFNESTPENLAWQEAIRLTRPRLHYSTHNCEHGGAFYVISEAQPELAAELGRLTSAFDIPLDTVGESPDAPDEAYAPGVFPGFDIESLARSSPSDWNAGQSSFEHCQPLGTFGLIAEAPYWMEAPDAWIDELPVMHSSITVFVRRWSGDVVRLVDHHLPDLESSSWRGASRYIAALREMRGYALARSQRAPIEGLVDASAAAVQWRSARFNLLRPIGMLLQLAAATATADPRNERARLAELAARHYLDAALSEPRLIKGLKRVPLRQSVGLQVLAGLTAACMLKGG